MVRAVIAVCVAALLCAGASGASGAAQSGFPTTQYVTIDGAGGVQLSCRLVLPAPEAPEGGWPAIVMYRGVDNHAPFLETGVAFAVAGMASMMCDERGTQAWGGQSGGSFDLAGPDDAADSQAIFDWLSARPDVSDTQIGAYGEDLGGAEVWDAAVAGVPFKALVPIDGYTSLDRLLHPSGGTDVSRVAFFTAVGPPTWNTPSGIAARSYLAGIRSVKIPTLVIHHRAFYLGDLSDGTVAYKMLGGPKRLLITWKNGTTTQDIPEIVAWFQEYLAGGPEVGQGVEVQHAAPDATTTTFPVLPSTRPLSVNLPGSALTRSVRLPGGPLEMFGGATITIRYSGASWTQVVAVVSLSKDPNGPILTEGAAQVTRKAGVLKIRLLNEMALLPRGKRLFVRLSGGGSLFADPSGGTISIGRVTLGLSVLQRAVSH